jgi:hypothetical protein
MRALVVLALAPCLAVACSRRVPREPASSTFDEAEFRVTLPGAWTENKSGGEYGFASPARRENLTVSALSIPGEDPRSVVDQLVQARRSAVQRASPGAVISRPVYEEAAGTLRARFHATDAAAGRYTSCLFVATKNEALTAVFSEYGKPAEADAADRAEAIFGGFTVK